MVTHVFLDFGGQVVVDDELDVGDVQTSGGHVGRDQHFTLLRAKVTKGLLTFPLKSEKEEKNVLAHYSPVLPRTPM